MAPQLNGSTAVIDSALGHRVGFWNPSIYKFATSWNSPFTPLEQSGTSNDNIFYTGTPGTVYNPATGLGVSELRVAGSRFRSSRASGTRTARLEAAPLPRERGRFDSTEMNTGAPGRSRTRNLTGRNRLLYPVELQGRADKAY